MNRSPLAVFWINPTENTYSSKLMEFIGLNPPYLYLVMELNIHAGYVDGL
jgi:hypothetical protein